MIENVNPGPTLAIDTATAALTVALTDGDKLLGERMVQADRNHSVRLLPEIDDLVREAGLRPRDVRAVAVGCGPGSYTGVRIGIASAKTFAWALGIPIYAVSSLEALAYGAWRGIAAEGPSVDAGSIWIVPVLDARRGQAYSALFQTAKDDAADWRRLADDSIALFRPQAEAWIRGGRGQAKTIAFIGEIDGGLQSGLDEAAEVAANAPAASDASAAGIADAGADFSATPSTAAMADAAAGAGIAVVRRTATIAARDIAALARRYGQRALVSDPHDLLPNYTQQTEAEVKLSAGSGTL